MAISHLKKIIFIHIAKTGGTSIVRNTGYEFKIDGHTSILHYKKNHPDIFDTYTKMCLVRNPWDRFVSAYEYVRMENSYYHNDKNIHPDYETIKSLSFEDMVEGFVSEQLTLKGHAWSRQFERIQNEKGEKEIDHVFKTEEMNSDSKFREFFPEINHINKSSRKSLDYRDYYTEKTKKSIGEYFTQDVEMFEYSY